MPSIASVPIERVLQLSDKICFGFEQEKGSDPITRRLAVQLMCADTDEPLTDLSIIEPKKDGEVIYFDFAKDLECFVRTTIPDGDNIVGFEDMTNKKDFYVRYGESISNSEDCEENKLDIDNKTDVFTVINSYSQFFQNDFLSLNSVLSCRPEKRVMCKGSFDWLWTCGLAGQTATYVIVHDEGTFLGNYTISSDTQVLAIGDGNIGIGGNQVNRDSITKIVIRVGDKSYETCFIDCCCNDDCGYDIYFLESEGGYSLINFECAKETSIEREGYEICNEPSCTTSLDQALAYYGVQYVSKNNWKSILLEKNFHVDCDNEKFYESFGSATRFFTRTKTNLGTYVMTPVIMRKSSVSIRRDNEPSKIIFEGVFAPNVKNHTFG